MRIKILIGVCLLLIAGLFAGCAIDPSPMPIMVGQVLADGSPVVIKWYGQCRITGQQLLDIGADFVSVTCGNIGTIEAPEKGVAIEFSSMPPDNVLARIDSLMPGCQREGQLDWSPHAAALKSVALVEGSPRATVYRMHNGIVYEVSNCRVCQAAYDQYMSGNIKLYNPSYNWQAPENKDCFVLVDFLYEAPYGNEVGIPIIVDKIIK